MNQKNVILYLGVGREQSRQDIPLLQNSVSSGERRQGLCVTVTSLQALKTEETKEKIKGGRTKYSLWDKNTDVRALATVSSKVTSDAVEEGSPSTGSNKCTSLGMSQVEPYIQGMQRKKNL